MMDKIRLGIVDDHALFREGLKRSFENKDNISIVLEAKNGKSLIDLLETPDQNSIPEVLLLDIQMPEMDGIATAIWLKRNKPKIKIIILSMHNAFEMVLRFLQIGVDGYLTKNTDSD